jgi:hypothetical protein
VAKDTKIFLKCSAIGFAPEATQALSASLMFAIIGEGIEEKL